MSTSKTQFSSIDDYIDAAPEAVRDTLRTLRQAIKDEAPEAAETISYGMPTFKLNDKVLIYFAAWKHHIALYPFTDSMEASIEGLSAHKAGQGTLQFPLDKPLPIPLIQSIVRFQVGEILGKNKTL